MSFPARKPPEEQVSLREAKANLSRITKQALAGGRVVITNHGSPIADLVPHGTGTPSLRRIKRPGPLPTPIQLKGKGPDAATILSRDRAR